MDLLITIAISLLLVPLVLFTTNVLRIIIGLAFLLFFPGYVLVAAIYPQKNSISAFERVALSFGLSIAVVPLIGLIVNYTPWGISPLPIVLSILIYLVIMSIVAWYRRQRLPYISRFKINLDFHHSYKMYKISNSLVPKSRWNKVLVVSLIIVILGTIGTIAYVSTVPKAGDTFTEFYILGEQGNAENYPKEVTLGETVNVIAGIVNHNQDNLEYRVEITINGERAAYYGPIILAQTEKWEQIVSFTPMHAGSSQKVEFLLFIGEAAEPYQMLYLWLTVNESLET